MTYSNLSVLAKWRWHHEVNSEVKQRICMKLNVKRSVTLVWKKRVVFTRINPLSLIPMTFAFLQIFIHSMNILKAHVFITINDCSRVQIVSSQNLNRSILISSCHIWCHKWRSQISIKWVIEQTNLLVSIKLFEQKKMFLLHCNHCH